MIKMGEHTVGNLSKIQVILKVHSHILEYLTVLCNQSQKRGNTFASIWWNDSVNHKYHWNLLTKILISRTHFVNIVMCNWCFRWNLRKVCFFKYGLENWKQVQQFHQATESPQLTLWKIPFDCQQIASGNFVEKNDNFFQFFWKFLAIFWQSNGNFLEGQLHRQSSVRV